jgi:hypothetical protein
LPTDEDVTTLPLDEDETPGLPPDEEELLATGEELEDEGITGGLS